MNWLQQLFQALFGNSGSGFGGSVGLGGGSGGGGILPFLLQLFATGYGMNQMNNAQDQLGRLLGQEQGAANLAQNPQQMMARVLGYEQPLSANLKRSVMDNVAPMLGQKGLATSPGMATLITSQALAPYEQQQQQQAINLAQNGLNMPFAINPSLISNQANAGLDTAGMMGILGSSLPELGSLLASLF